MKYKNVSGRELTLPLINRTISIDEVFDSAISINNSNFEVVKEVKEEKEVSTSKKIK